MDYLENGNIKNSVNFPSCDAGVCNTLGRIAVLHRNIPNMLTKFTKIFGDLDINISNMINKSRGDYAYSIIDIEAESTNDIVTAITNIQGVLKVRIIK